MCPVGAVVFFLWWLCGGVLLSHRVSPAVPWALAGLASGFGMGPGVSPPPWPPHIYSGPRVGGFPAAPAPRGGWGWGVREPDSGCVAWVAGPGAPGVFVPAGGGVSPRPISTGPLNSLPSVHVRPIDPMVCGGP